MVSQVWCEAGPKHILLNYPDKPVSAIILVQPLVIKDPVTKEDTISIGTSIVGRPTYGADFTDVLPLQFRMPVGKRDNHFYAPVIFIREKEGSSFKIEMKNSYVFQQGHHYYKGMQDKDGAFEVPVVKISSGIIRHTVLHGVDIAGRFEPMDKLEIL